MLLICTFILIIYKCTSITLVSLIVDTGTIVLYNNSVYSTQFFTSHSKFSCSYTNLFTYKQSVQNLQNNSPYQLSINGISQSTLISISTQYGIMAPTLSQSSCNNDCIVDIRNFCPNPVGLFHYFDTVILNIEGMQTFTYNVLCNKDFGTSTF
jgi:hypothetical protein